MIGAFLLIGVTSYFSAYHEAEEIYDAQLAHFARVLHALTEHEIEDGDILARTIGSDDNLPYHAYEKNFAYRVWLDDGIVLHTGNSTDFGPATQRIGYADRMINEEQWRFFVLRDENVMIEVAERYAIRQDLIAHILGGIFLPQLLILPVLGLVIWFGVAYGVRPLEVLSRVIREREPHDLAPIEAPVIPREVTPLLDAINDLMRRTSDLLEHEKQFSNYAAHELRTPLAAIRTQLQVALRTEDPDKARQLFRDTLPATERLQKLVEQLLTFVRLQRSDAAFERLDFSALCNAAMRDDAPAAIKARRHLSGDIAPGIFLLGNADMLRAMLRNLIDNALKYTDPGGNAHVTLYAQDNVIRLSVCDDGIGIAPAQRDKLFDSFYRAAAHHAEGSGLGLAIVKWVAEAHHATIEISEGQDSKGTCFTILFQPAPADRQ